MNPIEAAVAAIEALEPEESFRFEGIAARYGVNPVTLARRHRQCQAPRATQAVNQRKLNP